MEPRPGTPPDRSVNGTSCCRERRRSSDQAGPLRAWKNPENLTVHQAARLAWIAKTDPRLYRADLLKEGLRHVFVVKGDAGKEALDRWLE